MNRHLTLALALFLVGAPALAQESQPQGPPVPADLELYSEASLLMHRQEHAKAHALLGKLLTEHPQTAVRVEAMFWRAKCLEELDRPSDARQAYQALVAAYAQSGWARDAKGRLAALEAMGRTRIASARALRIQPGTEHQTLVLANGDRISGRVVSADGEHVQVFADGLGNVTVPRTGIAQVYRKGAGNAAPRAHSAPRWFANTRGAGTAGEGDDSGREALILSLLAGDEEEVIEVDDGEKTTVVEEDGTRTTTTIHADGSKTVTRVQTTKDGKKIVTVEKTGKEDAKKRRRIELKLDGDDFDLDEDLRDLPKKLKLRIKKKLDGLDLEDLDFDFDFDGLEGLDDLKELKELKELTDLEGLKDLPRKLREQIEKGLGKGKGRHRRILRLHDEDEHGDHEGDHEEDVFILRGKDGEKHVKILKRIGEHAKRLGEGAKTFTRRIKPGENPNVYRFGDDNVWVGGGAGEHDFFFGGEPSQDRVFLRNGDKISGTLQRVTEKHVEMKTSYGEVKIDRGQVRQITFKGKKQVKKIKKIKKIIRGGAKRPHLGIFLGEAEGGVLVSGVQKGSAAEKAGLKEGDVIRALGDRKIGSLGDLREAMATRKVGETVGILVTRGDKQVEVRATLGVARAGSMAAPQAPHAPEAPMAPRPRKAPTPRSAWRNGRPFLGVSLEESDKGPRITGTIEGGLVHGLLKEGDVILSVGDKSIKTTEELVQALGGMKPGQVIDMKVRRGGDKVLRLRLPLGPLPKADAPRARQLRKF